MKKILISTLALAAAAVVGAQTARNLVITDIDGKETIFPADKVEKILFEDAPDYITLTDVLVLGYEEKDGAGYYHLELGTSPADDDRNPLEIGDMQVVLNLRAPMTEDLTHPVLPAGEYLPGKGEEDWTYDVLRSSVWLRVAEGYDGVSTLMIMDGPIDVNCDQNGNYDLRMSLVTNEGEVDFRYEGKLEFPVGRADFEVFEEDLDLTFQGAQGRFYGNWAYPFSADLNMSFYVGTVSDDSFVEGYWLDLDFNETKPEDCMAPKQRVADGVYTPESREEIYDYTYLPFRFNKGKKMELFGEEYIVGTRLVYTEETGHRKLGLITGGSFTVSNNGTKFEFDLLTAEGARLQGVYEGVPTIVNYCDNDVKEPERPFSTLTDDVDLTWKQGTMALSYSLGHSILEDLNTIAFFVTTPDMNSGAFIQMELFSTEEVITNGTYTVSWTLQDRGIIPGTIDYGASAIFSWYCDLDKTDDIGYLTDLGCLAEGTMTVSDAENGEKHIVFDLRDDAGNAIRGEYTGEILDLTSSLAEVPAKAAMKSVSDKSPLTRFPLRLKK